MKKFIFGLICGLAVATTVFMFPPNSIRKIMEKRYSPQTLYEELKKQGISIRNTNTESAEPTEADGYEITIEKLTPQSSSGVQLGAEDTESAELTEEDEYDIAIETGTTDSYQMKNIYEKVLSHKESLNWLRKKGYTVRKADSGYNIIYKSPDYIKEVSLRGGGTRIDSLRDFQSGRNVSLRYERGSIHIAIPK